MGDESTPAPMFAAIDKGFYGKYGIDAKANLFPTGPEMINAMIAGKVGTATVGTVVLFAAVEKDVPLRIIGINHGVASAENYSTSYIVARPGAGIGVGEIANLKGKKVGVPVGTDGDGALRAFLRSVGLTTSDVEVINVAPPNVVSAVQQASVDAVCLFEPWPSNVLTQVPGSIRVNTAYPPTFQPGCIISTEEYVKANRAVLVDFLAGVAEGQQWGRKNPDELLAIIPRYVPAVAPAAAKEALPRVSFDIRLSKIVLNSLRDKTMADLVTLGVVKQAFDPAKAVDHTLIAEVEKAHPALFSDLPPIPADARLS
jgi:sulfonate transport system substrate-binding protein